MDTELQALNLSQIELANKIREGAPILCERNFPSINTAISARLEMTANSNEGTVTVYINNNAYQSFSILMPCSFVSRQVHTIARVFNELIPDFYWYSKCMELRANFLKARQDVLATLGISSMKEIKTAHSHIRTAKLCYSLASEFHKGQVDKAGRPYIEHPVTLAKEFSDECLQSIALLHDVLEDTDCTPKLLKAQGISEIVIASVEHLTRKKGVEYGKYVDELTKDPYAMLIKLADLTHNMDLSRLKNYDVRVYNRCVRYTKAAETILQVMKARGGKL